MRMFLTLGPIGFLSGGGTWASLIAMLAAYAIGFFTWPFVYQLVTLILLFCAAMWAIIYTKNQFGQRRDPAEIVIDEVVGVFLVFLGLPLTSARIVAGLLLFRLFDIYKPWLVTRSEQLPHAWGIMLDDCVAAFFSWCLLHIMCAIGWL